MPEEIKENKTKALNIDILAIIKKHPDVSSINIFYTIANDEVQLKGIEIVPILNTLESVSIN